MESDDDRYRLPEFTFHEACLLTVQLTPQGLRFIIMSSWEEPAAACAPQREIR